MPLQIIGAGLGRTGTTSLKTALDELGFPCYHMFETLKKHPEHMPIWKGLLEGTTDLDTFDWELLFGEYNAAVDWPACIHWESHMKRYPDAKVILSVRDPEAWYKSMSQTILKIIPNKANRNYPWYEYLAAHLPPFRKRTVFLKSVLKIAFGNNETIGTPAAKEHAIRCYNEHNERVKAMVPKDRLLVFQVSEGWGPLCKFLGVPVPKTPFPNVNDSKEFQKLIAGRKKMLRISFLALSTAVGVGIYGTIAMFPNIKSSLRKGVDSLLNLLRISGTKSERLLTL